MVPLPGILSLLTGNFLLKVESQVSVDHSLFQAVRMREWREKKEEEKEREKGGVQIVETAQRDVYPGCQTLF